MKYIILRMMCCRSKYLSKINELNDYARKIIDEKMDLTEILKN